jgi:hypothetical protein
MILIKLPHKPIILSPTEKYKRFFTDEFTILTSVQVYQDMSGAYGDVWTRRFTYND